MVYLSSVVQENKNPSEYSEIVNKHYDEIAAVFGDSELSTMRDDVIRLRETIALVHAIRSYLSSFASQDIVLADIGCGNGVTLSTLSAEFPSLRLIGYEPNEKLRSIALNRGVAPIYAGNLLDTQSFRERFNVIVCQRVFINILNREDQIEALNNLMSLAMPGSLFLSIEGYESGYELTQLVREEVGLERVSVPYHNLFLPDSFFDVDWLEPVDLGISEHFLSTHYFVAYVLHPLLVKIAGLEWKRNSTFLREFSSCLPNAGLFGQNRFKSFVVV